MVTNPKINNENENYKKVKKYKLVDPKLDSCGDNCIANLKGFFFLQQNGSLSC